jgi:hypothetical protein
MKWIEWRIYEQYEMANSVRNSKHLYYAYSQRLSKLMKKLWFSW